MRNTCAAGLLLAAAIAAAPKPDLDIPANSGTIEALRRMQARSGRNLPSQAFPQRESGLAGLGSAASAYDALQLRAGLAAPRREMLRWSDSARGAGFFLSPGLELGMGSRSGSDSDQTASLVGVGGRVYGTLFPRLAYYSHALAYTEFTDRPQFTHQFNPDLGETYSVEKGTGDSLLSDRTFNRFEHYLLLDLPWVTFKAGRDRLHMGPGYFSSLMAGRDTPPYYLVEARIDFAPWLSLDDYLLRMTDTRHDLRKYASLHRFEFRPLRSLSLAFQDIVIYEDRDVDGRYLLPLTPLAFSEDNAGGGDNDAMGFDFLYSGIPNVSAWGELFIDDLMAPTAFFDDFWENRWAALAGFQAVSPWPRVDADLIVEWSHVEPWTYLGRTPQSGFKHFNVPSASKLGPDARSVDVQLAWRPLAWLELKERFEANDKGVGRQATLGVVHDDLLDGTGKEFLGGDVREERFLHHAVSFRWRQHAEGAIYWIQGLGSGDTDHFGSAVSLAW